MSAEASEFPRFVRGRYVARSNVLHLVGVEHEPYTIHRPGVSTCAIVTTLCKRPLQGVPIDDPLPGDRVCSQCEARFEVRCPTCDSALADPASGWSIAAPECSDRWHTEAEDLLTDGNGDSRPLTDQEWEAFAKVAGFEP